MAENQADERRVEEAVLNFSQSVVDAIGVLNRRISILEDLVLESRIDGSNSKANLTEDS